MYKDIAGFNITPPPPPPPHHEGAYSFSRVKMISTGLLLGPEGQLEKHMKANISVTNSVPTETKNNKA
jgi:hypothetical protein